MTRQEIIKKYGDVQVIFRSYYQYRFVYSSELLNDRNRIEVDIGDGNPKTICEIALGEIHDIDDLFENYEHAIDSISVFDPDYLDNGWDIIYAQEYDN